MACGGLGWTPQTFWASTTADLLDAIDGFAASKGVESVPTKKERATDLKTLMSRAPLKTGSIKKT